MCVCVCARPLSLTQTFFHPSQPGSCAWFSPFLLCAKHSYSLMCVCLHMFAWNCVISLIHINKYKQNHDDVTCNIQVETQIDVYGDAKQAAKWQVFRHVTEYNTNKWNTTNVSVFRTLRGFWILIPSLPSWGHYRSTGPSFDTLWVCVPLYISIHMHIVLSLSLWVLFDSCCFITS